MVRAPMNKRILRDFTGSWFRLIYELAGVVHLPPDERANSTHF